MTAAHCALPICPMFSSRLFQRTAPGLSASASSARSARSGIESPNTCGDVAIQRCRGTVPTLLPTNRARSRERREKIVSSTRRAVFFRSLGLPAHSRGLSAKPRILFTASTPIRLRTRHGNASVQFSTWPSKRCPLPTATRGTSVPGMGVN